MGEWVCELLCVCDRKDQYNPFGGVWGASPTQCTYDQIKNTNTPDCTISLISSACACARHTHTDRNPTREILENEKNKKTHRHTQNGKIQFVSTISLYVNGLSNYNIYACFVYAWWCVCVCRETFILRRGFLNAFHIVCYLLEFKQWMHLLGKVVNLWLKIKEL